MKRDFIIYGAGDFAHTVYDIIINSMKRKVAFFCIDDEYFIDGMSIEGVPILGKSHLDKIKDASEYAVAIGFVGRSMSQERQKAYCELKQRNFHFDNVIDGTVDCPDDMGEGNIIMRNAFFGYATKVGNCNIIWPGVILPHNNKIGSFNVFGPAASLSGYSCVGNNCFLGNSSTANNYIRIADYTYVGAGAYVSKDTERETVIVPQKSIVLEKKSCWDFDR